jgi:eukaryotic-like serine/threonine-protein kinase
MSDFCSLCQESESGAYCPSHGVLHRPFTVADRYEVDELIGAGARSFVFGGRRRMPGAAIQVAIKLLRPHVLADLEARHRFLREAGALCLFQHPNAIRVRDAGWDDALRAAYLVMDREAGQPADAMVKQTGPLPWAQAVPLLVQICRAVAAAHARGITDGHLTARKVFIVTGAVRQFTKLRGFGLSSAAAAMGGTTFDDVYGLGTIAHQLVTGRLPLEGSSPAGMLSDDPIRVNERFPALALPDALDDLIRACRLRDPMLRPSLAEIEAGLLALGAPMTSRPPIEHDSDEATAIIPSLVSPSAAAAVPAVPSPRAPGLPAMPYRAPAAPTAYAADAAMALGHAAPTMTSPPPAVLGYARPAFVAAPTTVLALGTAREPVSAWRESFDAASSTLPTPRLDAADLDMDDDLARGSDALGFPVAAGSGNISEAARAAPGVRGSSPVVHPAHVGGAASRENSSSGYPVIGGAANAPGARGSSPVVHPAHMGGAASRESSSSGYPVVVATSAPGSRDSSPIGDPASVGAAAPRESSSSGYPAIRGTASAPGSPSADAGRPAIGSSGSYESSLAGYPVVQPGDVPGSHDSSLDDAPEGRISGAASPGEARDRASAPPRRIWRWVMLAVSGGVLAAAVIAAVVLQSNAAAPAPSAVPASAASDVPSKGAAAQPAAPAIEPGARIP